jgi:hypothetical protein
MIGHMVEYGNGVSQVSGQAGGGGGGGGQTVDVGASVVHSIGHTVDQIAALPPHILIIAAIAILFGLILLKRAF